MERELLITGIGGQGVQLAAQVLARGATLEGRNVCCFGVYGGMMRGGNTDSTVVVADGPIAGAAASCRTRGRRSRCTTSTGRRSSRKLRPGGLVLVNDATFDDRARRAASPVHPGRRRPTSRPSSATRSAARW